MFIHTPIDVLNAETTEINGKRWYVTPNGTYPSVTTMLDNQPKPWLDDWKNMLGPAKAKQETERAAERGTAVHLMCEHYLNNIDTQDIIKGQSREHIALFNQIKLALNGRVNNIIAQEVALWSDVLMLAGRTDCIAEYDGVLSVVDFKSSTNVKDEQKIENYFLQCTAYALMFYEMYGIEIEDIVVIIASEKGLMPSVFKRKIFDYIDPLQQRITEFFESL